MHHTFCVLQVYTHEPTNRELRTLYDKSKKNYNLLSVVKLIKGRRHCVTDAMISEYEVTLTVVYFQKRFELTSRQARS